ncbi:MAG: 23S rRNA (uracil(1939)-C(5))-methyltransferase RlmD [Candidatus Izemoplasmataceae bacterium]
MVEKNAYYEVEFTDLTHDAMGVCKVDGYPIFVKDALKGEKALIKIIKTNKNFGFGRLIEIKQESPFRKLPICEHYQECGGCNIMHMNYQTQLDFKKYRTQETLKKLGKIDAQVHHTVGMNNPFYYRNKAIIPFGMQNGKIVAGLYKPRSHDIVNIRRCHVFPKLVSDMIRFFRSLFTEFDVDIYDEQTHEGFLRALMFRYSRAYDQYSITFITTSSKFLQKDIILEKVLKKYPNVVSIIQNINDEQTNVLLGDKSKVLFGKDVLEDELLGIKYEISHRSFYQVNPEQTEVLYKKAMDYAELKPTDTVIDAYCGIGTIGLTAAKHVKEVIGFDVVKDAIKNAQQNAKNNHIKNAKFIIGKAEDIMPTIKNTAIDVLFIDPPRKGCDKKFLEAIILSKVKRIVYISCNISTLARDLNFLQANGYKVKEVTPFDMFPQTSHIESITLLDKI